MARSRSGENLVDDAYKRSDMQSATDRFPRAEVLRYVNQGGAELWDYIVEARGRAYCRSATPWTITTTADTSFYTSGYPSDFYKLVSVRLDEEGQRAPLAPLTPHEEPLLRDAEESIPTHYDLRPTGILLLPEHSAGLSVVVDYVKNWADLSDSSGSTFDGIDGWEEYIVLFAARCMAVKDEEWSLAQALDRDMDRMRERLKRLAPVKDTFRAERVQDVRGPRMFARRWW